jgi:hypothetical protein
VGEDKETRLSLIPITFLKLGSTFSNGAKPRYALFSGPIDILVDEHNVSHRLLKRARIEVFDHS